MTDLDNFWELRGGRVHSDENGNICLNDLWYLAGSPQNGRPYDWRRGARAKALEQVLQDRITENFRNSSKKEMEPAAYVKGRGAKALTFAHPVLALDYAEYLNPDIGVEVREIFLRYRAEQTIRNQELSAQGKRAGCKTSDYAELHNSGYRGLYNGLDAIGIHKLKKLTKNQKILDHMSAAEGAANVFRVTQAKVAMQARQPKTPEEAFKIAHEAGVETREAMRRIGGVMPENMPVADNIKEAERRLKTYSPLLEKK